MPDPGPFNGPHPTDVFSQFWMDMMSKMAPGAFTAPRASTSASDETMRQFRQAFFDSWAVHCEQFMRSEQFLGLMKKSMDSALAFREQLNEFLTKTLHENQMPARSDTDSILLVLRSMEERVLERIEGLNQRVSSLESRLGGTDPGTESGEGKRRPKESTR
jgi:hypothetical protein